MNRGISQKNALSRGRDMLKTLTTVMLQIFMILGLLKVLFYLSCTACELSLMHALKLLYH